RLLRQGRPHSHAQDDTRGAGRRRGAGAGPGRPRRDVARRSSSIRHAVAKAGAADRARPHGGAARRLVVADSEKEVVRSLEDLPGTRVGVSAPGGSEQAWLAWLLSRAGVNSARVSLLSRGERGLPHAIGAGEVQSALVREPAASRLLTAGQAHLLVD